MARIQGTTVRKQQFVPDPNIDTKKLAEARINGGMDTMTDPADIENSAMQLVQNANVRFDRTIRRPGNILFEPGKIDSNPVLRIASIKKNDGVGYLLRMTSAGIHYVNGNIWSPIAGALSGTEFDRFSTAVVLDNLVFTNNGADPVQVVDFSTFTFAQLGNAPNFRYITGFYERAVGFAVRGENEVMVGWSGQGNLPEWDPLVDESAGFKSLMESSADLSDFIKGGFAWDNLMIILREKSIWHAQKQPIPQDPFNFRTAVPGIGCDCPYSAQIIGPNSLAWLDTRTATVWAYSAGALPESIGRKIEKEIIKNVNDPDTVFGAFNAKENEYTIYIPQAGSKYVIGWTYNLRTHAWSKNEYYALTSADDAGMATAVITIDQLGDVPIDQLVGTIDELSPVGDIREARVYGRSDGEIMLEDENSDTDPPHADFDNLEIEFETVLTSKAFTVPADDIYICKLVLEYEAVRGGQFKIEYSNNGGATSESWRTGKVVTPRKLGEPTLLIWRKVIKSRRFAWRITTTAGLFATLAYEVHIQQAGDSRK